jgi:single-strand DNA-binding protein
MKSLRNKVQLIGHLGMDPEVKNLNNGKKVARFSIATSDFYKDQQGNRVQDTQWHNVVVWGGLVQVVENYLKKGSEIALEGKLVHRSYDNANGEKKYVTEIVANDLVMMKKAQ